MPAVSTGTRRRTDSALAAALYLTAISLLAQGIGEALSVGGVAAPFGSLRWRFGFLGVVFLNLPLPLLGMALGSLAAVLFRHRGVLLAFAALQTVLGLGGLLAFLMFALDATQMASTVPAPLQAGYTASVIQTGLMGAVGVGLLLILGIASWRAARRDPLAGRRPAGDASLVVGGA